MEPRENKTSKISQIIAVDNSTLRFEYPRKQISVGEKQILEIISDSKFEDKSEPSKSIQHYPIDYLKIFMEQQQEEISVNHVQCCNCETSPFDN